MKCQKCGKISKKTDEFCEKCGTKLNKNNEEKTPKNKSKKLLSKRYVIPFLSLGLVLCFIIVYFLFFSYKTYDFKELYNIKVEGVNGYGNLVIEKKKNLPSSSLDKLLETTTIKSTKNSNLKNGDIITITIKYDEKISKKEKIKVTKEYKYEVKNLEEGKVLDLFKDLELTYSNKSPYLKITVANKSIDTEKYNINYKVSSLDANKPSESKNLYKNGEKIKVTATFDKEKLIKDGFIVETENKEYEISNHDTYITSAKELTEERLSPLLNKMSNRINKHITQENLLKTCANKSYCKKYKFKVTKAPRLVGLYFGYKEGAQSRDNFDSTHTTLIGIYEVTYKHDGAGEMEYEKYFYVHEDNFYLTKDGALSSFKDGDNIDWDNYNKGNSDNYLTSVANAEGDEYKFQFEQIKK